MRGLPPGFDPGVFLGQAVESICFYPHQIYLYFTGSVSLRLVGEFSLQSNGPRLDAEAPGTRSAELLNLVGRTVLASRTEGSTLVIELGQNVSLRCYESSSFESYHVYSNGGEYTV